MRHPEKRVTKGLFQKEEAAALRFLIHNWGCTDGWSFALSDIPECHRRAVRRLVVRMTLAPGRVEGTVEFTSKARELYERHLTYQ